jgi:hypothetical protein
MENLKRGAAAIVGVAESDLAQAAQVSNSMSPLEPPMTMLFTPEAA